MEKVAISACLLGELCRYDGITKIDNSVIEAFKEWEVIPFCPEAPLFGTPRERINLLHVKGEEKIFTDETNRDVTQALIDETKKFISAHPDIKKIVLKSKSPSCGLGTTPLLNEQKEIIALSDGLSAAIFKKHYTNIEIVDEKNF